MPTNEERREVAARLRMLSSHREVDKELVEDALGLYMGECIDGYDPVSVTELADLIEPEPERTCRDIAEPPKGGGFWPAPHFKCSECDGEHVSIDYVSYCPKCGAKVVGDE